MEDLTTIIGVPIIMRYVKTYQLNGNVTRQVLLLDENKDGDDKEVGHFTIDGICKTGKCECFNGNGICAMGISVDDYLLGKNLTRIMMKFMFENITKEITVDDNQLLYIDTDASQGFWPRIGMTQSRYAFSTRNVNGAGYQSVITYRDLKKYFNDSKSARNKSRVKTVGKSARNKSRVKTVGKLVRNKSRGKTARGKKNSYSI